MGNSGGKNKNGKEVDDHISEKLAQESKMLTINVLLLGPGGGGKTTILKQMERVHGVKSTLSMKDRGRQGNRGLTGPIILERERSETDTNETKPFFKQKSEDNKDEEDPLLSVAVQQALVQDIETHIMSDICYLCKCNLKGREDKSDEYDLEDKSLIPVVEQFAKEVNYIMEEDEFRLNKRQAELVSRLWKDKGIKQTFDLKKNVRDMDNTAYFLDRIQNYVEPTYKTTFEDYVRVRDMTNGIVTSKLESAIDKRRICIQLTDVGGQRTERKKWLGLFDGTDVVMWVMSLASYDQLLFEDNMQNRYDDAFELFQTHCHDKNFKKTEFVVFLNKFDLFEEKLAKIPFTKYDRQFDESKANDPNAVIAFVQQRHEAMFHKQEKTTGLYFHITCATDNNQIEKVITSFRFSWIKKALEANAFM